MFTRNEERFPLQRSRTVRNRPSLSLTPSFQLSLTGRHGKRSYRQESVL